MKTRKFTISRFERSSGRESALTNSRLNQAALLAGQPTQQSANGSPLQRFNAPALRSFSEGGSTLSPRRSPAKAGQRPRERAIALVITLILLSVTLVMAVAFLAISRRERGSVSTTQDATTAEFATDSGLARAEARIVSQMLMTTNPYVFSLIVSTNYINRLGFTVGSASLTNVNYDYEAPAPNGNGGGPISGADLLQNIANLYYDPRPPVFYSNDFRFYLDLNRNGRYDTNGWVADENDFGTTNGFGTFSYQVGDPEWIGILAHPDQPHGPNNPFIARYCFIAVPANSADLNYIHNQALNLRERAVGEGAGDPPGAGVDGYSRDQGVGAWEINLAAFLADLNTNRWDPILPGPTYTYPEGPVNGTGFGASIAFDDARALVAWRYHDLYPLLANADTLFGGPAGWGDFAFKNSGIDYYSLGQQYTLDTNFYGNGAPYLEPSYGNPATPWLGAPQTNDYFSSPSELFNVSRSDLSFVSNLYSAGTNYSTYDRYTFYRMLGQLGTDTQPASGKVNVNYQNAVLSYDFSRADIAKYGFAITNVATNITIIPNMETNFQSWSPHDFFIAAADKLLRAYTTEWFEESPSNYMQTYYGYNGNGIAGPISGFTSYTNLDGLNITNIQYYGQTNQIPSFGITNIPVYINGSFVYTPAVNRLLQLAANIYDASTNTSTTINSNYPSVFRPVFYKAIERNYFLNRVFTNVYIRGYQYVPQPLNPASDWENAILTMPFEVTDPAFPYGYSLTNVWGVPWIVGAKKGLPNLNGLEVDNSFFIERELQFNRSDNIAGSLTRTYWTNQMYIMGVSNSFVMDDWNSYSDTFADQVTIVARDAFGFGLSNDAAGYIPMSSYYTTASNETIAGWQGNTVPTLANSFMFPLGTNVFYPQNLSAPVSGPPSSNNEYIYHASPTTVTFQNLGGTYNFKGPCFIATSLTPPNYMDTNNNFGTPPLPHLVTQTTNRLQAFMLDTQNPNAPYILDYVQLGGMNAGLDVNQAIADPDGAVATGNNQIGGLWSTNLYSDSDTPFGVVEQYIVSKGGSTFPTADSDEGNGTQQTGWTTAPVPGLGGVNSVIAQQAYFSAFFSPQDNAPYSGTGNQGGYITNLDTSMQAPFTPIRVALQRYVYQANDPLVHYMTQDLYDFPDTTNSHYPLNLPPAGPLYVGPGKPSDRYMPWGQPGNLAQLPLNSITPDNNAYNYSYRDPLVTAPDYWDFPTNKYPTVGWLGRVHRGTPWQTVYLKSYDILTQTFQASANSQIVYNGVPTWQLWTGNVYNQYDAINTAPDQDRLLFDLFTAAPDDDAMRGQVSVNIGADDPTNMLAGLASWSALLSGTLALTNNQSDYIFNATGPQYPPAFASWTIQPLGPPPYPNGYATNTALGAIVAGINSARTNYGAYPAIDGLRGVFEHVGDILRVPQLSVQSPLLNWNDSGQEQNGINDEMYEWLPQQMMGLLTVSGTAQNPPRYVIYCYGQTLKPVQNGLVSSGQYFGMCTNYQVTAESASRAVIEVQNTPTPANPNATPHVVVVQYNPLPPD